ncbi:MAG TPA: alkaline phosphatase family protein [Ktedonobacteraceae bacterium]|nr:alkaline phosphatase family protein [Ktedonobacteraceae bacterium]
MKRKGKLHLVWLSIAIAILAACLGALFVGLPAVELFQDPATASNTPLRESRLPPIKTVFVIIMENKDWADIYNNPSAPYINRTLLPMASYAKQYHTPPELESSLPNYLWLEAGTNFGILDDRSPSVYHQSTHNHLVTLLEKTGHSWKAYLEGISGTVCPLQDNGLYAVRHNPTVYFDDVTDTNTPTSQHCIAHERPFTELATDLQHHTVANYNYIVPNLCDDTHNSSGCPSNDIVKTGDSWLAATVPIILHSQAYQRGGLLLITWDEATQDEHVLGHISVEDEPDGTPENPIGLIALSPYAKGHGYSNTIAYTHSSTLLTVEEIFGLTPLLGDAAHATDLGDLFLPVHPRPSSWPPPLSLSFPRPIATLRPTSHAQGPKP